MKLTPFSKVFISAIILAVVGYTAYVKLPRGGSWSSGDKPEDGKAPPAKDTPRAGSIVVGVNDFGGAYPLILANDGAKAGPGSLFKKAGLDVEIKLIRGSKERLKAFDDGQVQVMLLTLDYVANLVPVYKEKGTELRSFLLIDWSRGNIGIVAKPELASIESLKKARIATTRYTPTHYFLLSLLDKSNLAPADIEGIKERLVFATKTPEAGQLFQRGEVDAVSIWEPHLSQATASGKGRTLVTTATATNLIADVLFAREGWIKEHEKDLPAFAGVFFEAVKQIEQSPDQAIALSAKAFEQKPEEIAATLRKIKPATFADNRDFFGMAREDCPYDRLYLEASRFWQKEGLFKTAVADPRDTKWLKALEGVAAQYKDERVVEKFQFKAAPDKKAPSLLSKSVSIYFASGKSELDPNAKKVIDGFADTLAVFQNAYVRIEGNTDNVGGRAPNIALSQARADSVLRYLTEKHGIDRARIFAVGNGPDAPVSDNRTAEGRELNRRTEFKIIKNAEDDAGAARGAAGDGGSEVIRAAIESHNAEVRACYERGLKKKPDLAGRVTVQLTIAPSGAVEKSAVGESTLGSALVERCLQAAAMRWQFPRSSAQGPTMVNHAFVLQPN